MRVTGNEQADVLAKLGVKRQYHGSDPADAGVLLKEWAQTALRRYWKESNG